ncbi:RING finger protein [Arthroderma uncinatum]|uniref:RING finger protein n=1 Tax=Arthroderma uncinatum TaxID=74035 RepID=UPI00144A8FE9|nr:RING finger protein [Arthroderma uncinatum]KAF3480825.1 RING finger protein [Arthroderma uncinatum]
MRGSRYSSPRVPPTEDDRDEMRSRSPSWTERGDLQDFAGQSGSVTRSSSTSGISRQSRMSRLGTRILPNSVLRNLLNSGEETPAEGRAHRDGLLSRSSPRSDSPQPSPYFPSFRSLSTRGITRRRSIRGPYPLPRGESALLPDSPPNPTFLENPSNTRNTDPSRLSWRYRARLSNVRHSISSPISHIFNQHSPSSQSTQTTTPPPPRRPSRAGLSDDSDHLLHPHGSIDPGMDIDEPHEPDGIDPTSRPRSHPIPVPNRQNNSTSASRGHSSTIRSRATRLLRREEQTPLSRVLQLAATAIAAQLSGNTSPAVPSIQSVGADGLDGPLESLMNGLQQVSTNQEAIDNGDASREDPNVPHVNFLRVFRFVNQDGPPTQTPSGEEGENGGDQMDIDGQGSTDGRQERRLLTLVVVGVRAIPPNNGAGGDATANNRLNVESLLRLPLLAPGNFLRNDRGSGNFLRRSDGRSRFSPRRYSVGGSTFPANYDSQRHVRSQTSSRRQSDVGSSGDLASSLPTIISDSPQGPNPPPSTPAEAGLSRVSSAVNTPSRRPSSASAILPQLDEDATGEPGDVLSEHPMGFNPARQRRRSDSEAARHRGLGSGAARRNGVVEPDDPSPSGGRSWLIYVVGTNLAENHPAFAAPSLFTDNPTYEDMVLLSSLLGPAKPPVATQDDISSAGGLYRLVEYSGALVAESLEGGDHDNVPIAESERCLICLCDYEAADEVRILNKCKHVYHRECIDEWLTTGRNSCPLCRGEGVSNSDNVASSEAIAP